MVEDLSIEGSHRRSHVQRTNTTGNILVLLLTLYRCRDPAWNCANTPRLLLQAYMLIDRYLDLQSLNPTISATWIHKLVCPFLVRQAVLFTLFCQVLPSQVYRISNRWLPAGLPTVRSLAVARNAVYAQLLRGSDAVQRHSGFEVRGTPAQKRAADDLLLILEQLNQCRVGLKRLLGSRAWSNGEWALSIHYPAISSH